MHCLQNQGSEYPLGRCKVPTHTVSETSLALHACCNMWPAWNLSLDKPCFPAWHVLCSRRIFYRLKDFAFRPSCPVVSSQFDPWPEPVPSAHLTWQTTTFFFFSIIASAHALDPIAIWNWMQCSLWPPFTFAWVSCGQVYMCPSRSFGHWRGNMGGPHHRGFAASCCDSSLRMKDW